MKTLIASALLAALAGFAGGESVVAAAQRDSAPQEQPDLSRADVAYDQATATGLRYNLPFAERRRQEETVCARQGLNSNSVAFLRCVASLDARLFNAQFPEP